MSSTHEAFSLPTTSPSFHPDAFNPETLTTPTTSTSSYSYPPPSSGGAYDYVPAGTRSRQSTILPLHSSSSLPPLPAYPPLSHTWDRLRGWLSREYPELGDTLNYGILPQDLAQVEMSMGLVLPPTVRESYLCVDGQEAESAAGCSEGLFFGLTLLPLEDVLEEWRFWREVDDDPNTGANPRLREVMQSIPTSWVRREYSSRGWIPLVADKAGNYLGVDMNPGEGGAAGQVIVFGRDFDTKVVMWRGDGPSGWGKWLASFVDELESGEGFELGGANDGSEGSEDSVGYESYFFDGVGGGQGDTGGDAGTGGLRMAGEYRGWNVLEAWADRSVRRWQEAGLYSNESYPVWEKGKVPEKISLDRLPSSSGAEVPIPVFSEVEETSALTTTPLGNVTNTSQPSRPGVPSISVSKPPAPLPVELPTPEPISSPPADIRSLPIDDLEAGGGIVMREIDSNSSVSTIPLSKPPTPHDIRRRSNPIDPVRIPSPPSRVLTDSPDTIIEVGPASFHTPDLLASSDIDVHPAHSGPSHASIDDVVLDLVGKVDDDSPVFIQAEDTGELDPPIRLVGGGGISGIVDDSAQNDVAFIDEPQPVELTPVLSNDSTIAAGGKHKKKKRIASSLKSIGQLGSGKRRSDSLSLEGSG
ncbi:uncharacterized protein FIBRA_04140 [Fibroporia radiculosa]|uniref:Knr4/Smi1-like domain-containing protein n=1 Tax=Fibroporia radiculosa TaxID=599839 RepID=J4H2T1_9APHY|nr:uncharacterized protein FIBRA_04140 [Fibroporia radiculosa]CCM02064.1 predicted protein [Fibroporia radiculosa]